MEDGRIVEEGSPGELLKNGGKGRFRGLVRASGEGALERMLKEVDDEV